MLGIDLNKNIEYKVSSLRFFDENEHHVARFCSSDVLLLVYEGVLRFSEDGKQEEVRAGEYYIQKRNTYQAGELVSDSPKYLYVHFIAEWTDGESVLARRGIFDYSEFSPLIQKLDKLAHGDYTYVERSAIFLAILSKLHGSRPIENTPAKKIANYIDKEYLNIISLDEICKEFHYSKNHVINIFKEEYGTTPFDYINEMKIRRAMYLLEVTSKPIDTIALESGFNHYSHFYRLFTRKTGTSPFEWRKKIKISPV